MKNILRDKNAEGEHIPILLKESLDLLELKSGQVVVDCTTNRAGHALEFAKIIGSDGVLICFDLDKEALSEAEKIIDKLEKNKPTVHYINDNFANIEYALSELNIDKVDVVYADLGLSSQEIDTSGRGFSFMRDEPLLMTFKSEPSEEDITAAYIVNNWEENNIADILYYLSDEKYSRRIAKTIISERKRVVIKTTLQLVKIIEDSVPVYYKNGKTHCATKTFQALRMATNREVDNLKNLIQALPKILKEDGRAGFITFHSIEDKIVKVACRETGLAKVNKKIIAPTREELLENRRSRSAKLRIYKN